MARVIILMGVSGCGKTTIGKKLATQLQVPFFDGDDFHPETNIAKMEQQIPLNDKDRNPWLNILAENLNNWGNTSGAVLACSALKETYRQLLTAQKNPIDWIYLSGCYQTIKERLEQRKKHFMKVSLLQSQFDILEVPSYGIHINISENPDHIVSEIIEKLYSNV